MDTQLVIGLPKGSLNTPGRGSTAEILEKAGYQMRGYAPGKEDDTELKVTNVSWLEPMLIRPKNAPNEMMRGTLDAAIIGDDAAAEAALGGIILERVAGLGYGTTRLVAAAPYATAIQKLIDEKESASGTVVVWTEYLNLTRNWLMQNGLEKEEIGTVMPGSYSPPRMIAQVVYSDGLTELAAKRGLADCIVETTQTGSGLRKAGLVEIEQILDSQAALYVRPGLGSSQIRIAEELATDMQSVVTAQQKSYVLFNVSGEQRIPMEKYLAEKGLYADEPTMVLGANWAQFAVLIEQGLWLPTRRELSALGAQSIVRLEPQQVYSKGGLRP